MIRKVALGLALAASVSGCLGNNALRMKALRFNLTAVEGRWGREGLFVAMFIPVYLICTLLDMFIFNSIEFWAGENPINGKRALVDVPKSELDKLGLDQVEVARVERLSTDRASLYVEFENGDRATFDVVRDRDTYTVSYGGVEFFKGNLRL